jgi:hypothetical protein
MCLPLLSKRMEGLMGEKIIIDLDEYIGAVKLNGKWRFFHEMMSVWILDYKSYDPQYDPFGPKSNGWRKNLLVVDTDNAEAFCEVMRDKELLPEQIPQSFTEFGSRKKLSFVVNFDEKIYINGWGDNIALHDYVPTGWQSIEDDPYEYVPPEIRALWKDQS